jgi:hypothetical protein
MFFNGKYRILKKMHYVADQQGIIKRYLKEATGWATHLENTKNAIRKSAENKNNGNCAILGSGWLLDIPLDFLLNKFSKIYLFDVLHPTQVKHKYYKNKNIIFIELDITGGAINEFYNAVQLHKSTKKRKEPSEFQFRGFQFEEPFDFVASVNILNQLDILLIDYIKGYNLYSDEELMEFRKRIQQRHFESLPVSKTCIITDYEELVYNSSNELEASHKLVHINLPSEKLTSKWQWQFDNQTYYPGKNVVFNVLSMDL